MRVAAAGQAVLLAILAAAVLSRAGVVELPIIRDLPSLAWVAVLFSAASLVLNTISRSAGERRIWVPVAVVMLASSLIVATGRST